MNGGGWCIGGSMVIDAEKRWLWEMRRQKDDKENRYIGM